MSYHGSPPRGYNETGIEVVNPLIRIEEKLRKIQEALNNADATVLSVEDLKSKLQKVLDE